MQPLARTDLEDGVVRLSLQTGRGNPVTMALLDAMHEQLSTFEADPPRALVLDGGGSRIFSGGLALPTVIDWDRDQIRDYLNRFGSLIHRVLLLPCPAVAGLAGHAIAGGFVMSLCCDVRIVGDAGLKFGLAEVDLGLGIPAGTLELISARLSPQTTALLAMQGRLFAPDEALHFGFAAERSADPEARAISIARVLARKPGIGASTIRTFLNAPIVERMKVADQMYMEAFLDTWFSEAAQERMRAQVDRMTRKR